MKIPFLPILAVALIGIPPSRGAPQSFPRPPDAYRKSIEAQVTRDLKAPYYLNNFTQWKIRYSDVVPVAFDQAAENGSRPQAVVFGYVSAFVHVENAPFRAEGIAIFCENRLIKILAPSDNSASWPEGRPYPCPDQAEARRQAGIRRFRQSEHFHDLATGPAFQRRMYRQVWEKYRFALEPPADSAFSSTIRLLVAREAAPIDAQFQCLTEGLDAFSAETARRVSAARSDADRNLAQAIGQDSLNHLEARAAAAAIAIAIDQNEQKELEDAGIPLSSTQEFALGLIYQAARDHDLHPNWRELQAPDDQSESGLTGLDGLILTQATATISQAQLKVLQRYFSDARLYQRWRHFHPSRDAEFDLNDPVYGRVFQRNLRRRALAGYLKPIEDLELTPDRTASLKDLIAAQACSEQAAIETLRRNMPSAMALKSSQVASLRAETKKKIEQLIGEESAARLNELKDFEIYRSHFDAEELEVLQLYGAPIGHEKLLAAERATWEIRSPLRNVLANSLRTKFVGDAPGLSALDQAWLDRCQGLLSKQQFDILRQFFSDRHVLAVSVFK